MSSRSGNRVVGFALVAALALCAGGCGAMFGDKQRRLTINSVPAGAEAILDGTPVGYTPVVVSVDNRKSHEVLLRNQQGTAVCRVDAEIDATWLILDILAFPIGVIVYGATGAWKEMESGVCHAVLPGAPPVWGPPAGTPPGWQPPPPGYPQQPRPGAPTSSRARPPARR